MHQSLLILTRNKPEPKDIAAILDPYCEDNFYINVVCSDEIDFNEWQDPDPNIKPFHWDWYEIGGRFRQFYRTPVMPAKEFPLRARDEPHQYDSVCASLIDMDGKPDSKYVFVCGRRKVDPDWGSWVKFCIDAARNADGWITVVDYHW